MAKLHSESKIRRAFDHTLDFLFPAEESVRKLEHISAEELVRILRKSEREQRATAGNIYSLFAYRDERVKHLVWEIKYFKNQKMADAVGVLLAEEIKKRIGTKIRHMHTTTEDTGADAGGMTEQFLLVPIPLTYRRLQERGFNHTEMIARAILKNLEHAPENSRRSSGQKFEIAGEILKKVKNTPKQSSIENRQDRFQNIVGAFAVSDPALARGKNIVIIDDVTTTGATIGEAKKVLIAAGARSVEAFVIAH